MDQILRFALARFIRRGSLTVVTPSGLRFVAGDGSEPAVTVRLTSRSAIRRLLTDPELAFGELYMDGELRIEQGSLYDLVSLALDQPQMLPHWGKLQYVIRFAFRYLHQFNPRYRASRNVAHHYDIDGRLYDLFLDSDRQYSCAYFTDDRVSLDDAQQAKKRHLASKLLLSPGQSVLEIGSGWGGLALYLARIAGVNVTGVTLSREQLAISESRATDQQLGGQAKFKLEDYRDTRGRFDRIVSVGMFEHVGVDHYDRFFSHCAELLDDDGVMLLHSIGRPEGPGITNPWIAKYIFPGGYIPALSEVLPAIERAGLLVSDVEILRMHYAETIKAWRERFAARRQEAVDLYDEKFARMWEFYLLLSEMAFRKQNMMNFQIQLTKRQTIVPITRDYIAAEERRYLTVEQSRRQKLLVAGE